MGKLYTPKTTSTNTTLTERPKDEIIRFILDYSKILEMNKSKTLKTVDYLLN